MPITQAEVDAPLPTRTPRQRPVGQPVYGDLLSPAAAGSPGSPTSPGPSEPSGSPEGADAPRDGGAPGADLSASGLPAAATASATHAAAPPRAPGSAGPTTGHAPAPTGPPLVPPQTPGPPPYGADAPPYGPDTPSYGTDAPPYRPDAPSYGPGGTSYGSGAPAGDPTFGRPGDPAPAHPGEPATGHAGPPSAPPAGDQPTAPPTDDPRADAGDGGDAPGGQPAPEAVTGERSGPPTSVIVGATLVTAALLVLVALSVPLLLQHLRQGGPDFAVGDCVVREDGEPRSADCSEPGAYEIVERVSRLEECPAYPYQHAITVSSPESTVFCLDPVGGNAGEAETLPAPGRDDGADR